MSPPRGQYIKPLTYRIVELLQALQLIQDSIAHVRRGELRHLVPLSGQLRALLTERSKKTDPLLLYVATALKRELHLYCTPSVDESAFNKVVGSEGLALAGVFFSPHQQLRSQARLTLKQVLEHRILRWSGRTYVTVPFSTPRQAGRDSASCGGAMPFREAVGAGA